MSQPDDRTFTTAGALLVHRRSTSLAREGAGEQLIDALDARRGAYFSSSCEYPGRYQRWDIGFVDPPLVLTARGATLDIEALNARGGVLLEILCDTLRACAAIAGVDATPRRLRVTPRSPRPVLYEEERSRRHSLFSVLRHLLGVLRSDEDSHLGLYGAFGYDLAFQFEEIAPRQRRDDDARDMVLYLPDRLLVVDHRRESAYEVRYDFSFGEKTTVGLPRDGAVCAFVAGSAGAEGEPRSDHAPGEYAATVRMAQERFRRGELFEAVPSQTFFMPCGDGPASVFRRLLRRNPAPYGALINLGEQEYLVAASPEMFVRVRGRRVETCPISGTIARGRDALEDAARIRELLNSEKDAAELSMCTDVDRNDKARVCVPGSVRVLGRRQIELYSRLIHTVDHVEGTLKPDFDALDAFLSHAWAVTVTGAPKQAAIQFIEDHEKSPRRWYGGALGWLTCNGDMNTGLTLRTIRIDKGVAEVRAGATLLFDSDPDAEEAETRLKAAALLDALRPRLEEPGPGQPAPVVALADRARPRVLMVDHRDSFVHMLSSCFQTQGAEVVTVRFDRAAAALEAFDPLLVVLSPGPGRPVDFGMEATIRRVLAQGRALFGVCLGLQGIVEYFGGELAQMDAPVHGKASRLQVVDGALFNGIAGTISAGRYHSLAAALVPSCLAVTARAGDLPMAVEHRELPVWAVQFHPESILSMEDGAGERVIANVLRASMDRAVPLRAGARPHEPRKVGAAREARVGPACRGVSG